MFAAAKEYVSTRPLLVFFPFARAINGDEVDTVWQSRLTFPGTRLRLEQGRLHCLFEDRWHDTRLTAAIYLADAGLPSDKEVLKDLLQGRAILRAHATTDDIDVAPVDLVATSDLLPLLRVDPSYEFATLMSASEDLRYAAEDVGLRVLARDVGQDRCVSLAISTPGGDELLAVECDTSFGAWNATVDARFEPALEFASRSIGRVGSPHFESVGFDIQACDVELLCERLLEALPDVWQSADEIRYEQMTM
jgi:hypothetical protein